MRTPDVMPILSRGAHRRPSKGACFMEFASYLAGEAWSDSPQCTHPVLAALAREVNDRVGDEVRQQLVPLIPDVVGLHPSDRCTGAWIAREAALTALRSGTRHRGVAVVGILNCEELLNHLEGRPVTLLSPRSRYALEAAPDAHAWAVSFVSQQGELHRADFDRHAAPAIVASSVQTVIDSDGMGEEAAAGLLSDCIDLCRTWMQPAVVDELGLPRPDWSPDATRLPREVVSPVA